MWPDRGTKIQSLIFDQAAFTAAAAKRWAKNHKFRYGNVDEKLTTIRIRQGDPAGFVKTTFRTIELRPGVKAVVGVPVKRINPRNRIAGPPPLSAQFINQFQHRDAMKPERLSKDVIEEIAWELGYEQEDFAKLLQIPAAGCGVQRGPARRLQPGQVAAGARESWQADAPTQ